MAQPITAAQVRDALMVLKRDGGDPWPLIESYMIHSSVRIEKLEVAIRFLGAKCKAAGIIEGPAQETAEPQQAQEPPSNGTRIGADGSPLDPAQSATEDAMDAAIAAGGGRPSPAQRTQPAPVPGQPARIQRPMPPRGGVRMPPPGATAPAEAERIGADGTPITDPAQLAAEAAMDAAMSGD